MNEYNPDVTGKIFIHDDKVYMLKLITNDSSRDIIGKKVVLWSYGWGSKGYHYMGAIKDVIVEKKYVVWIFEDDTIQAKYGGWSNSKTCADLLFEVEELEQIKIQNHTPHGIHS